MIHVTQEMTQFKGTKLDLSVELTALLRHCFNEHVFTKEDVLYFIDLASKSDEELHAETDKKSEEIRQRIDDMDMPDEVKDMLKDLANVCLK